MTSGRSPHRGWRNDSTGETREDYYSHGDLGAQKVHKNHHPSCSSNSVSRSCLEGGSDGGFGGDGGYEGGSRRSTRSSASGGRGGSNLGIKLVQDQVTAANCETNKNI